MSYNLTVTVTDGQASVETSGQVPDGKWVVYGHGDAPMASLGVTEYTPAGNVVAAATSQHSKEG